MTPKEKLHTLETNIRQVLPRLLEPTDGCLFKSKTGVIHTLVGYNDVNEKFVFKCMDTEFNELFNSIEKIDFEIIGHEILLSDVLDWFDKIHFKPEESITMFDEIIAEQGITSIVSLWDFSKKYLSEQPEILIDFLYKILKK